MLDFCDTLSKQKPTPQHKLCGLAIKQLFIILTSILYAAVFNCALSCLIPIYIYKIIYQAYRFIVFYQFTTLKLIL